MCTSRPSSIPHRAVRATLPHPLGRCTLYRIRVTSKPLAHAALAPAQQGLHNSAAAQRGSAPRAQAGIEARALGTQLRQGRRRLTQSLLGMKLPPLLIAAAWLAAAAALSVGAAADVCVIKMTFNSDTAINVTMKALYSSPAQ